MSVVLYFSKLNLVSGEIFEAYEDASVLPKILSVMASELRSNSYYVKTQIVDLGNGETEVSKVEYKLSVIDKTDTSIEGRIYKSSKLHFNILDEMTEELIPRSTPNSECIRFYIDIFNEIIVFHTTNRFGYREFNEALENIINDCMQKAEKDFLFTVDLRTEGIAISDFRQKIKEIGNIKELRFKMQPPNPDTPLRKRILENGEVAIDDMIKANITGMNAIFTSKSSFGLNLESPIIDNNLSKAEAIDQFIGDNQATARGYVTVEALARNGKRYTTADAKPKKFEVDDLKEFVDKCKRAINSIF